MTCPCCSTLDYEACCKPFHEGGEPSDAVALMRSRYSAFALGDADYLWRTLHPSHEDRSREKAAVLAAYQRTSAQTEYKALAILDSSPQDEDGMHHVLFRANMATAGRDVSFVELSRFTRTTKGRIGLRYCSGITAESSALPQELTVDTFSDIWQKAQGKQ